MKAVTLPQPHASLVAAGVQTILTLPRPTDWRGDLLIHAGMRVEGAHDPGWAEFHNLAYPDTTYKLLRPADARFHALPLGAVVAVARVTDCVPIRDESAGLAAYWPNWNAFWIGVDGLGDLHLWDRDIGVIGLGHQLPYADFTPGRWALLLYDVRPVHVPDVKGRSGLWTPDPDLTARVEDAT